ncbi:hypothetical protein GQ42DRAFT_177714 [Ramicandelaber brevisporus]|nr:hypothetical protein GQ42DRAFT_177714 [Ramicandelaber brevisporus]
MPGYMTLTAYQFYGAYDSNPPPTEPFYGPLIVLNFTHDCTLDTAFMERHDPPFKLFDIPANPPNASWTTSEMDMARNGSATVALVDMAEEFAGCRSMSRVIEQTNQVSDAIMKHYSVGPIRVLVFSHPVVTNSGDLDLNGHTDVDFGCKMTTFYDDYWLYVEQLGRSSNNSLHLLITSQENAEWMKAHAWSIDTARGPLYVRAIIDPGPWNRGLYSSHGTAMFAILRVLYSITLIVAIFWTLAAIKLRSTVWLTSHTIVLVTIGLGSLVGVIWPPPLLTRNWIAFVTSVAWWLATASVDIVMIRWTWLMQGTIKVSSPSSGSATSSPVDSPVQATQRTTRLLTAVRLASWTSLAVMILSHIPANFVVYILRTGWTETALLIHTIFQPTVIVVCNSTAIVACAIYLYSMGKRIYYDDERRFTIAALVMVILNGLFDTLNVLERIESIVLHVKTAAAIESLRQIMLFGANMTALWLSGNIHYVMATTMPGAHPGVELDPLGALTPHIPRNRNRSGGSIGSGGSSIGGGGISAVHPAEGKVRRRSRQLLV